MMEIALVLALFGILVLGGMGIFLLLRRNTDSAGSMADINQTLGSLHERLKSIDRLTEQTTSLENMLSNNQRRGGYGEIQLEDLVKDALPPGLYAFQHTLSNRTRADCLMRLPNPPGPIAVDSKFPFPAWKELSEAGGDDETGRARDKLATVLVKHVNDIAAKYIIPGETAECALMFLPLESIHAEIHANLPKVLEESFKKRVYIVSPTTMMATLNTVRAIYRDVHMRKEAVTIQSEVAKLLEDVARLGQRVGNLDSHFRNAQKDLGEIKTSTDKISARGERIVSIEVEDATDDKSDN